ncbi:DUF421 domain-containing protein [Kitasatospora cineracea]|uniref:Uncharacterized membrane protein YcaP (DUF421 family) n=1 Tax=Kitasatospora cineracea TaxID=88074 RepID=A0A3N4R5Q0_9ACTN|nr:YetF domain-containing protein [Kitasatospora cineracea]ROR37850.1 uncharacterized membrane protein YcaP (DUF421 family) [Kitasatospora cineracea]RPE28728.1 uncharacterized membrane protein YcaP (DUF421 family) [Kitasatospora cineracea]
MWQDMFDAGISYGEKTLRTVLVYLALLVLLRVIGKRGLAQLNTFDLVVMLLLSNVVQNAVIGNDDSVTGGLYGALVLLATDWVLVRQAARWNWFNRLLDGTPTVLARDGVYDRRTIARQGIRVADLDVAVRHQGGDAIGETSLIVLEPGGTLLVKLKEGDQVADKADVAALRAALAAIEARLPAGPRGY